MNKPPTWFWIVAVVALLWALAGCASYLQQVSMGPAELAALDPAQRDLVAAMPTWLTAVFAIAVWTGLAAAVALLLRRRVARTLYIASLTAVIVQFGWIFTMTPILATMPVAQAVPFPAVIAVLQATLIWFTGKATAREWLQ